MKNLDVHAILKLGVFVAVIAALVVLATLKLISGAEAAVDVLLVGAFAVGFNGAPRPSTAISPDNKATTKMAFPFSRDSQRSTPPGVLMPKELPVVLCEGCPYKETAK